MSTERKNAVTLRGKAFTLVGPELKAGDAAPEFNLVQSKNMSPFSRADLKGKARVLSVVPSLDTPVCDAQTRRFQEEAESLQNVNIYTISMDLPFAQTRWCSASGVDKIHMLSDHRDASFSQAYGTLIKELRLACRALFVLDDENRLQHVEYVREVADHPDYEAALAAIRQVVDQQR